MKYLILIYHNPHVDQTWHGFTDAQRAEGWRYMRAFTQELADAGELIATEGLADRSLGKRVTLRDGQVMTTDGPFAEVKEYLAGFFLIQCESLERAIQRAARIPEAGYGLVEVRPVLELEALGQ